MPILGRSNESLSTRLFGRPGINEAGSAILGVATPQGRTQIANRLQEGFQNKGGFVGSNQASTGDGIDQYESEQLKTGGNSFVPFPTSTTRTTKQASGGNAGGSKGSSNPTGGLTDAQKRLQGQIKDSFSSTIDNYKKQISGLPGQQQDSMEQIDVLAGTQRQSITDALNAALAKFGGYKEEVAGNQKNTLQDLADNTRNMFAAGNNYLGARGAGNSSATGMYSAALTQQANRQRADVQEQTNKQYNDLNIAQEDTKTQAQQSLDQVETWKATQQATIINQYQELKRQLESAYANAKDSQKSAIANLSTQLLSQAQASLSNINSIASQYQNSLAESLQDQSGQTGEMTSQVGSVANSYQVGQIITENIEGMPNVTGDGQGNYLDQATGNIFKKLDDGTYSYMGNNGANGF